MSRPKPPAARKRKALTAAALAAGLSAGSAGAVDIIVGVAGPTPVAAFLALVSPDFGGGARFPVQVAETSPAGAVRAAQACAADGLILTSHALAQGLAAEGDAAAATPVFRSDRVLVGPVADPARAAAAPSTTAALEAIAQTRRRFYAVPETRETESELWRAVAVDPRPGRGDWYLEVEDADAALRLARLRGGYALVDRAAFAAMADKSGLAILRADEPALSVTHLLAPVTRRRCRDAMTEDAARLADWLRSAEGAEAMAAWTLDGETLLRPLEN